MGYALNLSDPKTFNEKLQWIKFNGTTPEMSILADKVDVRKHLTERGFGTYLNRLYGVWDKAEQIPWDQLPDQFVLKTNHGSGGVWVVQDKAKCNRAAINLEIAASLQSVYGLDLGEFHYEDITPKVFAEAYLEEADGDLKDYKFHCFHGKCHEVMIATDRQNDLKFLFADRGWNFLEYLKHPYHIQKPKSFGKPPHLAKMFDLAEALSNAYPFVRVDMFAVGEDIIFGELTFFPDSGFDPQFLPSIDMLWGSKLRLPTGNRPEL
jgi:hypothetical protein